MIADNAGMVCFAVGDYLDGYSKKVKGTAPHPRYDMCDQKRRRKGLVRLNAHEARTRSQRLGASSVARHAVDDRRHGDPTLSPGGIEPTVDCRHRARSA